MLKILLNFALCIYLTDCYIEHVGPRFPPTKGEVWPIPKVEFKNVTYFSYLPEEFEFKVTDNSCDLLTSAISRYQSYLKKLHDIIQKNKIYKEAIHPFFESNLPKDPNYIGIIKQLNVTLTHDCEDMPYDGMFEGYRIYIGGFDSNVIKLESNSIWGIIRGLETFSQLFYFTDNFSEIRINATQIDDSPEYLHRGLLLDTSRHFISVDKILTTLEAMAMNKMNVFHWHIVDDQSFPYQSKVFPDLSKNGAFHPSMVYTIDQIKKIIQFARERAIRVIPEFDVPGHTRSWGASYPMLLTECFDQKGTLAGLGPLNPINNITYKFLNDLFKELKDVFPEKYFHVGGDEVSLDCWESNPELVHYMNDHNITSSAKLHALFMERAIPLLETQNKVPIVWQEVFDEGVPLTNDTLVQIWKSGFLELYQVLKAGYKVIYSTSWYLDHLNSGGDWELYYNADPRALILDVNLAKRIHGGEACMWGEVVDDQNVISRVWPRTSAVAERLWSSPKKAPLLRRNPNVKNRIEEMTCKMIRRGINAQPPSGPGFCFY